MVGARTKFCLPGMEFFSHSYHLTNTSALRSECSGKGGFLLPSFQARFPPNYRCCHFLHCPYRRECPDSAPCVRHYGRVLCIHCFIAPGPPEGGAVAVSVHRETAQAKDQARPQVTQPQIEGQVSGPGSLMLTVFPQSFCSLVGLLKQNYFL